MKKKVFWILPVLAFAACGIKENVTEKLGNDMEKAQAELASQAYITSLAQSSIGAFSEAVSSAVNGKAAGAPALQALTADKVYSLKGETEIGGGASLALVQEKSSLTLRDGKPGKVLLHALQKLVNAKTADGKLDITGDITYAADLTYGTGGLFGKMTLAGTLTLTGGSQEPVLWSATINLTGQRYTVDLLVDGKPKSIGNGKAATLFPILALFEKADEPATPVCGTKVTTANYVASVTDAQSVFDYISTDDATAMGNPVSDVTVCFRPAFGGGYDVYAARTNEYPMRPVTGYTGPTAPNDPKIHYLANDFQFYGVAQTTVVVNSSATLFFDPLSSQINDSYVWPWFADNTYAIIGSSWDSGASHSTYSFLITETTHEFVVSASAVAVPSDTGAGDLQMILNLDTNEIVLTYGRYDIFGIAPGLYAGSVYSEPGAYKLVEYIPGTGLSYSPL